MRGMPAPLLQSAALFFSGLITAVIYVVFWSGGGDRYPAFLEATSLLWGAAWLRAVLEAARAHGLTRRGSEERG
ncbi:hypothetical protein [Streptomyces sp. NPDC058092]|uniref:hypothetical protein n=1 Tax=Streptomyces sp. NPDC058092 TaxID=3346336 RepID=UPI0036ECF08A